MLDSDFKWDEIDARVWPEGSDLSLRLLARWLISASRKAAPLADSGHFDGAQNTLDVGSDAKVGSEPETDEMPVQQALQGDTR
jgi:hypothetical protein